jgi:hypothetical protein
MILFDDGDTRQATDPTAHSRGQVLKIDEQTMTATLVFNADLGNYSGALGSAQRLSNGDYSFDSGRQGLPPHQIGQSIEVRPDGSKADVLQVSVPLYRAFRIGSLYGGISDQLGGSDGGERSRPGDDSNQQEGNGPNDASRAAGTDLPDDFGPEIIAAGTAFAGHPTTPTTLSGASLIWATPAALILVRQPADDPAIPILLHNATTAPPDALFAAAGNDLWHEGLGDDLVRALSS